MHISCLSHTDFLGEITEIELKRLQDELEFYQNWVKKFTWGLHEGFSVRFKAIWWLCWGGAAGGFKCYRVGP